MKSRIDDLRRLYRLLCPIRELSKERGYFIPKPGDGVAAPLTNDVFKDDRGLLWVTDKERGLDVIEYKN